MPVDLPSQSRHHLLHALLADVDVNLGGGDALVAEQGLDVFTRSAPAFGRWVASVWRNWCGLIFWPGALYFQDFRSGRQVSGNTRVS